MTSKDNTRAAYSVALVQMECEFLNIEKNKEKALQSVVRAADDGAALICLPEGFLTGYYAAELTEAAAFACEADDPSLEAFYEIARDRQVHLLLPFFERKGDEVYGSAVLIDDQGHAAGHCSKTHLTGAEKGIFTPGEDLPVWETKLGRIGCLICYDLCFPEAAATLAASGAQVILAPAAWRSTAYYTQWWDLNVSCRALDNLVYVGAVNQVGPASDGKFHEPEWFAGHSRLAGPTGDVIAAAGEESEEIVYGEIDLNRVAAEREGNSVLEDKRPELYK